MPIVKCDTCQKKYRIDDISKISNLKAKYKCTQCGRLFSIAGQLAQYMYRDSDDPSADVTQANQYAPDFALYPHTDYSPSVDLNNNQPFFIKLTLKKKFTVALGIIMLFSMFWTYLISDYVFQKGAETQIINNANFLLTAIEASRSYTSKVVKPALYKELPERFIVEAMSSSFGARNIFERIKKMYPEYYFKHASLNPRNEINLADKFEADIIQNQFRPNPEMQKWQGYRETKGGKDFVIMKPIWTDESCLKCHSVPEKAPKEIIEQYGSHAGFGLRSGDIIGALSISVPATDILGKAKRGMIIVNGIVFFCFISLIVTINLFFHQIVVKPIQKLIVIIEEISVGKIDKSIEADGGDEISDLARGFERMRISINLAMSKLR